MDLFSRVQILEILTRRMIMSGSTPQPLPIKIKKRVPNFNIREVAAALLTRNETEIWGHPAGTLLLSTLLIRPEPDNTVIVEYEWNVAKKIGGVPPDRVYRTFEHNSLPGVKE